MERNRIRTRQVVIKFIEENDQWVNLSPEVKEKITEFVSHLFVDWIKPSNGTEKGNCNE